MAKKAGSVQSVSDTPATISATEVARAVGRTVRWVQVIAKEQAVEKVARGRYPAGEILRGVVSHYEAILDGTEKKATANRATDARTREIEQRISIRERELIPIEDAVLAMDKVVGVVSAELSGLAARITRDLGVRKIAEAEVHGARKRIGEALAEMSGAARTGIGLDDAGGGADT